MSNTIYLEVNIHNLSILTFGGVYILVFEIFKQNGIFDKTCFILYKLTLIKHTRKGRDGGFQLFLKRPFRKHNLFSIPTQNICIQTQLGWSGLLVEPNPGAYDLLVAKKRNAYSINSCLATNRYFT